MLVRRLLAFMLICSLTLWTFGVKAAKAEPSLPASYDEALRILTHFRLVAGDATGYRPLDSLTRGEAAKLAIMGMGMGDQYSYYQGSNAFDDTKEHWAQGYIALARQLGIMRGYPDGTFRPDSQVTNAEAVAIMASVGGLGPTGSDWPLNWLRSAKDAGVVPADMSLDLNAPARRGDVFILLYRALTEIKDFSGSTLLQRRFKPMPPMIALDTLPAITKDLTVAITGTVDSAEHVKVNGVEGALRGNRFEAKVPLKIGSNTVVVTAVDIAGNTNMAQQQVVRENTEPARIVITGSHEFPAGKTGHLDVAILDTNGAPIDGRFNLMVTVPPSIGSFDAYSGTLYAAQAPAKGTIEFAIGDATASWDVAVGTGGLVALKIEPEQALVKRGQEQQFSLSGTDQYGNPIDVSALAPSWKAEGGVINAQGIFTPTTGGTATVTATVGEQRVETKVTVYGPPKKVGLSMQGLLTANNQDTVTVKVEVQDVDGNRVPDYLGKVQVTTTNALIANPTAFNVPITSGEGAVVVKAGNMPGIATLVAGATDLMSGSVDVTVEAQKLAAVVLATDPPVLDADGATKQELLVTAVDSHGKPMLTPVNPPLSVRLVSSNPNVVKFDATGSNNVDVVLGAIAPSTGTVSNKAVLVSGTAEATSSITGILVNAQQFPGMPVRPTQVRTMHVGTAVKLSFDKVQAVSTGTTVSLVLRVMDANGNQVSRLTDLQNMILTLKDQNGKTYPATVNLVQGTGRATFDVLLYKAGSYTFTATATSTSGTTAVQPASQTVMVLAGAPVSLVVSAEPTLLRADGGASRTTITATVQDQYGNTVPSGAFGILFQRIQSNGGTGTFKDTLVNSQQGIARVVVPSNIYVGSDVFTASASGLTTRNSVTITGAIIGVPSRLAIRYGDNNQDGLENSVGDNFSDVGAPVTVKVDVLDSQVPGYVVTSDNGRIVALMVKDLTTGTQQTLTAPIQFGTATFTVSKGLATTYSMQASTAGFSPVGTIGSGGSLPDLVLRSGAAAGLVVTPDLSTIRSNPSKSYATLTISLVDASGNPTIAAAPINVTLKASNQTYGTFTQDNSPGGTSTDTYNVLIPAGGSTSSPANWYSGNQFGPATIAASAAGYATGSTVITTKLVGPAFALRIDPLTDMVVQSYANDDSTVTGQDVKVTVLDSQGYQVTDYGASGEKVTLTTTNPGVVIVAYYDYVTGTWRSLDQVPGNLQGEYPTTAQVDAYKGVARFRVRSLSVGSYNYTATIVQAPPGGPVSQITNGRFVAGPLAKLSLVATPNFAIGGSTINPVAGGGRTISLDARFEDQNGNLVMDTTGTVDFEVLGAGYGRLLSSSAAVTNGIASAVFQSTALPPLPNGTFVIRAYTTVTKPGGAPLTIGSQANPAAATITIDSIAPAIQTVVVTPGGVTDQVIAAGDAITATFSEAIRPALVAANLQPGITLAGASVASMQVYVTSNSSGPSTINFGGGLSLGTVNLNQATTSLSPGTTSTYTVSSVSMNAAGTQVTVVLGAPVSGSILVDLTLSADPTQSTFTPAAALLDLAGNGMSSNPVPLNVGSGF